MRKLLLPEPNCRALRLPINKSLSPYLHGALTRPTLDCAPAERTEATSEFGMRKLVSRFLADQSGATAIEYCLIAVGISIVILVAVNSIGTQVNTKFTSVNSSLK
jgi:pilus assembly protein Flp/PilA